jgi:hypothetical protein
MQLDLRHLEKADDPDEPEWPIIDRLVKILPRRGGRPYLAAFALTHPDKDHIQGFAELLRRVHIGELWHTPKVFRDTEDHEVLCEDAVAFRNEAHRRCKAIIADPANIASGNRLRVIGRDDILKEARYKDLPAGCKSRPGEEVRIVDGLDLSSDFCAFIHAPFKDDQEESKNNTSLSLNIALFHDKKCGQFFFFGDREYPTIKRIFETTEQTENRAYLYWDVMLSSHHCSKCVMYWQGEGEETAGFKQDIMGFFEKYARQGAFVVASSHADFTDEAGDNPPHKKARNRYEAIVSAGHFICTHEYPSQKSASPLVFTVDDRGIQLDDARDRKKSVLAAAVASARGSTQPPGMQVGFGKPK